MKLLPNHEHSWDLDVTGGWASVTWESCHSGALVAVLKPFPKLLAPPSLPVHSIWPHFQAEKEEPEEPVPVLASCALCSSWNRVSHGFELSPGSEFRFCFHHKAERERGGCHVMFGSQLVRGLSLLVSRADMCLPQRWLVPSITECSPPGDQASQAWLRDRELRA